MDEKNKRIDDAWKENVEKEKVHSEQGGEFVPPVADFKFFVSTLSLQASIFLGLIENPVTNQKEEDVSQAKFIIDTLDMLKEKTKGNLDSEEGSFFENVLYELKMQYVEKTKK
ncbi:MAG: DUF1844 domain-containing protein [Candidatus Omnitrophota bacterium]